VILKTFNYGWGPEWLIKQFESHLVDTYLAPFAHDSLRTIVINSVWYGEQEHAKTCAELEQIEFDRIVLVAMLDAAIPQSSWFSQFKTPVFEVGYYPGKHSIDFWALAVDLYFKHINDAVSAQHINTPFMCLNRKPHWHRVQLYQELEKRQLLDSGIVSMGGDETRVARRILPHDQGGTDIAPNAGTDTHGIVNDIMSLGNPNIWRSHFLNVVTETVWDIDRNHFVSEKIYKPILGLRPFLVYDPTGAQNWLAKRGFEDYTKDFGDICNLDLSNPYNIPEFLSILSQQSTEWFGNKFLALQPKIMYNRTQFDQYVDQQKYLIQQGIQCQI